MNMIRSSDLVRYHAAAKLIEVDGVDAYQTCCARYGTEIASVLLVSHLRREAGAMNSFPAPENVPGDVQRILETHGLLVR